MSYVAMRSRLRVIEFYQYIEGSYLCYQTTHRVLETLAGSCRKLPIEGLQMFWNGELLETERLKTKNASRMLE